MSINLKLIALSLCLAVSSFSCATNDSYSSSKSISISKAGKANASYEEFIRGDAHLPQGKHSYSRIESVLHDFYNLESDESKFFIVKDLLRNYPESDLSYYMLGKIAENFGSLHAARTYITKSIKENLSLKFCHKRENCPINFDAEDSLLKIENAILKNCPSKYFLEIDTVDLLREISANGQTYINAVKFGDRKLEVVNGHVLIPNCLGENKISLYQGKVEIFFANINPKLFSSENPFSQRDWLSEVARNSIFENLSTQESLNNFELYWSLLTDHDKESFKSEFNDNLNVIEGKLKGYSSFYGLARFLNEKKYTQQVLRLERFNDEKWNILKSVNEKFDSIISELKSIDEFKSFIKECRYFSFSGFYCRDKFYIIDTSESLNELGFNKTSSHHSLKDSTYGVMLKLESVDTRDEIIKRETINSSYVVETHSVPNPEFTVAQTEYERAILKYETYMATEYNKNYSSRNALGAVAEGFNRASEKRKLNEEIDNAKNKLLSTSSTINKDIKRDYQYEMQTKRIDLLLSTSFYLFDSNMSWCKGAKSLVRKTKDFDFAYGAKGNDIIKNNAEHKVKSWIEESENVSFDEIETSKKSYFYDCVDNLKI